MILDATAGNRTMYNTKDSPHIIYLDIERLINVKPTIFADHSKLPFINNCFHTIFFDPPHDVGQDDSDVLTMGKIELKEAKATEKRLHTYYGVKWAPTIEALKLLVIRAQHEFMRVLADDGILWLKWCETILTLKRILRCFPEWEKILIIEQKPYKAKLGKGATYWVAMVKKNRVGEQADLLDTKFSSDSNNSPTDSSKRKRNLCDFFS